MHIIVQSTRRCYASCPKPTTAKGADPRLSAHARQLVLLMCSRGYMSAFAVSLLLYWTLMMRPAFSGCSTLGTLTVSSPFSSFAST